MNYLKPATYYTLSLNEDEMNLVYSALYFASLNIEEGDEDIEADLEELLDEIEEMLE